MMLLTTRPSLVTGNELFYDFLCPEDFTPSGQTPKELHFIMDTTTIPRRARPQARKANHPSLAPSVESGTKMVPFATGLSWLLAKGRPYLGHSMCLYRSEFSLCSRASGTLHG